MQGPKEKVAFGSVLASGGLTLAKAVVGLLSGSLAILSEAGHSAIDFGASLITYFAVRLSCKPADEDHPYGHEKFESIAALVETALLFLLSGNVIWEAGQRLLAGHGHGVEASI
jgi:cation diffusion facilitator family transporter